MTVGDAVFFAVLIGVATATCRGVYCSQGDRDFWPWTKVEVERRKQRRRRAARIAQHMAAGMTESMAKQAVSDEFSAESVAAHRAWQEANR